MVVIKNDIVYDKTKELKTDIYYPNDTSSNTKILIFWHGGGWFRGNKESVKNLGIRFANAGFMTFIPDYSLAPKYHFPARSEEHTSELQSRFDLVCRLLLEKKKNNITH